MFSTYAAWSLINAGMGYWPAFLLTVLLAFALGVVIERVVIRPVENAPVLAIVVIFIALLVILNSATGWIYSYTIKTFPSPFPRSLCSAILTFPRTSSAQSASHWWYWRCSMPSSASPRWTRNARRGGRTRNRAGWWHSRGLDARPRLGARGRRRRGRRHDDRAIVYLDPNMMGGILLYAFAAALLGGIDSPAARWSAASRSACSRTCSAPT